MAGKINAFGGEHDAASACIHQRQAHNLLKLAYLQADGGLGATQKLASLGEAAKINDCQKCPQNIRREINGGHRLLHRKTYQAIT